MVKRISTLVYQKLTVYTNQSQKSIFMHVLCSKNTHIIVFIARVQKSENRITDHRIIIKSKHGFRLQLSGRVHHRKCKICIIIPNLSMMKFYTPEWLYKRYFPSVSLIYKQTAVRGPAYNPLSRSGHPRISNLVFASAYYFPSWCLMLYWCDDDIPAKKRRSSNNWELLRSRHHPWQNCPLPKRVTRFHIMRRNKSLRSTYRL